MTVTLSGVIHRATERCSLHRSFAKSEAQVRLRRAPRVHHISEKTEIFKKTFFLLSLKYRKRKTWMFASACGNKILGVTYFKHERLFLTLSTPGSLHPTQ